MVIPCNPDSCLPLIPFRTRVELPRIRQAWTGTEPYSVYKQRARPHTPFLSSKGFLDRVLPSVNDVEDDATAPRGTLRGLPAPITRPHVVSRVTCVILS